ncbi:lysozyme inhibitor LprI family protein [Acetonema longum]|uniref:Lysozyme inhibitor LprI-like N-terminal domain-containing protein n=1 Tax=Acetonema longum DSM 6540 TaxID=1009370 RepID=F7NJG4_9FIRM|nr:lysozyme inhibitor LprI family protein [Acetonema longum]EGO63794.1 hypothetical protein ALO_11099 [Acetonema longum DSM 6540]
MEARDQMNNHMVKKLLVAMLLVLGVIAIHFSQGAWAADETSLTEQKNENFQVDRSDPGFRGNQGEMNEAAYREFKRADDKLNAIYAQIFVKYKNNKLFLDKLTSAEIAWIKFRDAHLESIYPEKDTTMHYGSVYPMVYYIGKANLTWDRVKQLNQWLIDYPEGTLGLGSRGQINADTAKSSEKTDPNGPMLVQFGSNVASFVPNGWKLIKQASGDLNEDGLDDIAGVIEYDAPYRRGLEEAPPRILFIALKEKNGYRLSIQKNKFILKADEGGVWGDPFHSISVDRGSCLITFYGGSNYRWAYDLRFRYQNEGWYLIGFTAENWYTGTGNGEKEDYNLLTGVEIISTVEKNAIVHEEAVNRGKKVINLKDISEPFDVVKK